MASSVSTQMIRLKSLLKEGNDNNPLVVYRLNFWPKPVTDNVFMLSGQSIAQYVSKGWKKTGTQSCKITIYHTVTLKATHIEVMKTCQINHDVRNKIHTIIFPNWSLMDPQIKN